MGSISHASIEEILSTKESCKDDYEEDPSNKNKRPHMVWLRQIQ